MHQNKAQTQSRVETRQEENHTVQLESSSADTQWNDQPAFYEVVGPYVDSAPTTRNTLPERAALPPADRQIAIPYNKADREHANKGKYLIHSYNQNGQQVFAATERSTIDFFI